MKKGFSCSIFSSIVINNKKPLTAVCWPLSEWQGLFRVNKNMKNLLEKRYFRDKNFIQIRDSWSSFAKVYAWEIFKDFSNFLSLFFSAFLPKKLVLFWKFFPLWKYNVGDYLIVFCCFFFSSVFSQKNYAHKENFFGPLAKV